MANKPQTLSQGQREEVIKIHRSQVLTWSLTGFAILAGITGLSLWGIKVAVERKMEALVAKQFEEPKIQSIVKDAAEARAASMLQEQIQPEVDKFKTDITQRLTELDQLVSRTKNLEQQSQDYSQKMQDVLAGLTKALDESQQTRDKIVGLKSDTVEMQKCVAEIQYYTLKGRNTFPNPYQQQIIDAFNKMISIVLPDPIERQKFISQLGGSEI